MRLPLLSRIVLGACLLGVAANAQQAAPPSAEDLLDEVASSYRMGDLHGAWDAFAAFLEHPSRNDLHVDAFAQCFYDQQCPQPGALGRILGKPRAELTSRIEGFCPRLRSPEVEAALLEAGAPESVVAQRRKMYERIVENGLHGTCADWRREQLDLMFEKPRVVRIHRDVLPLAWYEDQPGGFRTAIDVTIGATSLRMGVDTGASIGSLHRGSTEFPVAEVELSNRQTQSMGVIEYRVLTPARLASLRVGRTLHQPFALDVCDNERYWDFHPIAHNGDLGMVFLLRYPAVCFAWDEQRLYLGTLGPCAGGVEPDQPHLQGSLAVGFGVEAQDGTRFTASVDTGAFHTNCSAAFGEANSGDRAFLLGSQSALAGDCLFDDAVLYRSAEHGFPQMFVRMNFLLRFRAFGWQRHPLRVYFVPRSAEARTLSVDDVPIRTDGRRRLRGVSGEKNTPPRTVAASPMGKRRCHNRHLRIDREK